MLNYLVGVEVHHYYCSPLHAHNGDEKKKVHNNKYLEVSMKKIVEKKTLIPYTHVAQPTFENGDAWVV